MPSFKNNRAGSITIVCRKDAKKAKIFSIKLMYFFASFASLRRKYYFYELFRVSLVSTSPGAGARALR